MTRTGIPTIVSILVIAAFSAVAPAAHAGTKIHLLVIGNNQSPGDESATAPDRRLPTLQFADDDAAAFYDYMMAIADSGHLLTVMDRDTERLYSRLATVARAPSLEEARAAV